MQAGALLPAQIRAGVIGANLESDALYRTSAPMQLFLF